MDIATGKLEWIVNGYQTLGAATSAFTAPAVTASPSLEAMQAMAPFNPGEMKFPETKIGDAAFEPDKWLREVRVVGSEPASSAPPKLDLPKQPIPMAVPVPPPLKPRPYLRKDKRFS